MSNDQNIVIQQLRVHGMSSKILRAVTGFYMDIKLGRSTMMQERLYLMLKKVRLIYLRTQNQNLVEG